MDLSKRTFLKATGLGSLDPALSSLGFDLPKVQAAAKAFKLAGAREFTSVCNFCACNYVKERTARALKKARDENRSDTEQINGETVKVQRTDAIGLIGGSQVNNEECYQLVKMFRTLGAMTNPRYDLKNTKLARIEDSNLAECHPMGLKNLMKTKKNGLKIMNVDVRYNEDKRKYDMTTWQYQLVSHITGASVADILTWNYPLEHIVEHIMRDGGVHMAKRRGQITEKAMVTDRIKPLIINGTEVFITWQPYNRGFKGLSKGISGNYITIDALDPNAQSQEFKACLIDIKKA